MADASYPSQDMSQSTEKWMAADTLRPFTHPCLWPCPGVHPSHLRVHTPHQPLLGLLNPSCLVAASGLPLMTRSLLEVHDETMGEQGAIVGTPEGLATWWHLWTTGGMRR